MADEKKTEAAEEPQADPQWEGSLSSDKPLTSADGHETLSKEDLKARQ